MRGLDDAQLPHHEPNQLVRSFASVVYNNFTDELQCIGGDGIESPIAWISVEELWTAFLVKAIARLLDPILPLGANHREQRVVLVLKLLELSSGAAGLQRLEVAGAHVSDALLFKCRKLRVVEVDTASVFMQDKLVVAAVPGKHQGVLEDDPGRDELLGSPHDSHVGNGKDDEVVRCAVAEVDGARGKANTVVAVIICVVGHATRCKGKEHR